jgi:hypothetical protein
MRTYEEFLRDKAIIDQATQAWCEAETSGIEMDSRLAFTFAAILERECAELRHSAQCTRSHPHENMTVFCERLTEEAQSTNRLANECAELREERDFLKESLDQSHKDAKHFEAECMKLRDALTADAMMTVPVRDYASMSPKDCYEAGMMDGGYAVRSAIKIAAGEKP